MSSDTAPACKHTRLAFGSGGYYVMCRDCPQTWVARRIDAELDTDLGISALTPYTGTLEDPSEHNQRTQAAAAASWMAAREACALMATAIEDACDDGVLCKLGASAVAAARFRALPPPEDAATALAEVVRKAKREAFEEAAKEVEMLKGHNDATSRNATLEFVAATIRARGEGGGA